MSDNLVKRPAPTTTVVTTGKGLQKTIISGKPLVTSTTGKVVGANMVDITFVFDTTGSMSGKISNLIEVCTAFVEETSTMKLDAQFALISFGDISIRFGGDKIELVVPLTADIELVKHGFKYIPQNNGFGNTGESVLEAIDEAFKIEHRKGAVKVMVILTDEPALGWETKVEKTISTMTDREFLVFVVATDDPYYREMAEQNGGVFKEIENNPDLAEILAFLNEMAKKISEVVVKVQNPLIGDGSVKKYKEYLRLNPPKT